MYDGVKKHWPIKEIGGFQLPQVMLILQITIKDQVEGYFILESMTDPEAFDHKDFEFIKSLQDHIVSAFNKLGLMEELKNTLSNLESAYDQLKELDRYKEAMTAMIVHDFKNSLNTIINFSSSTPSQQRLRSIKNAGQLMLSMVLNILDIQKFEETTIVLAESNNPLEDLIMKAVEQVEYLIEQKSIHIKKNIPQNFSVRCDQNLITRCLVNYLTNAIKYSPTNGEIHINARKDGDLFRIEVVDNGKGIPQDKLKIVFDKYTQLSEKKSGGVRSTGIGLTFCKMVIEAHSCQVGVHSEVGKGSTFWFTLKPQINVGQPINREQPDASYVGHNDNSYGINDDLKSRLASTVDNLRKLQVYDYTEIKKIIRDIPEKDKESLQDWLDDLQAALHQVNQYRYKELLEIWD